jgi:hypothetical protein
VELVYGFNGSSVREKDLNLCKLSAILSFSLQSIKKLLAYTLKKYKINKKPG